MTLAAGDKAPAFALTDDTGATVRLKDYAGRRVLLFAYPAAMTPGCTKEACDFRDSLAVFGEHGIADPRHLPRQAGEAGEVQGARSPDVPAALRPGQGRPDRLRRLR